MLAKNLTTGFVFIIEVIAAMLAIKIVVSKDWNNLLAREKLTIGAACLQIPLYGALEFKK
jgi:hypothetical protein